MAYYTEKKLLSVKTAARSPLYGVELMRKYPEKFDWFSLQYDSDFTPEMALEFRYKINVRNYLYSHSEVVTEKFIRENPTMFEWSDINAYFRYPSEEFLNNFGDKIDWKLVYINDKMSLDFIEKNKDKFDWKNFPASNGKNQRKLLNEEFARKYADRIDWRDFSRIFIADQYKEISEEFLIEMKDRIHWDYVIYSRDLSEDLMNQIKDCKTFSWRYVSRHQKFSEEFFIDNLNNLDIQEVFQNEKLDFLEISFKNKKIELLLKLNDIEVIPTFKRR